MPADFLQNIFAIDFQKILTFVLLYFGVIWVLISLWVLSDAKKRYKDKSMLAIAMFLIVLVFNFPALILYLIIRPEHDDEHVFYFHDNYELQDNPGVNVPIVNFVGEDGFKISLTLNVGNPKSAKSSAIDVNVDWKSNDKDMEVKTDDREQKAEDSNEGMKELKNEEIEKIVPVREPFKNKISNRTKKVGDKFKGFKSNFSSKFKKKKAEEPAKSEEAAPESTDAPVEVKSEEPQQDNQNQESSEAEVKVESENSSEA